MSEKRRKFSPQFKAEAVQMVLETGKPIAEVARDLGVHDGTLGNRVATWLRDNPEPVPDLSPGERARVSEMEAEIRRLRVEFATTARQRELNGIIESEFEASRQTLGCRRITAALNARGIECPSAPSRT